MRTNLGQEKPVLQWHTGRQEAGQIQHDEHGCCSRQNRFHSQSHHQSRHTQQHINSAFSESLFVPCFNAVGWMMVMASILQQS